MRASLLTLAVFTFPFAADAAPKKTNPAVPAVPAMPTGIAKPPELIGSDLNGREMTFLSNAIELGKTFRYLASQVERTSNPALRGFSASTAAWFSSGGHVCCGTRTPVSRQLQRRDQSRSAGIGRGPAALPGSTVDAACAMLTWGFLTRTR